MIKFNKIHHIHSKTLPSGQTCAYINPEKGNGLSAFPRDENGETLLVERGNEQDSFVPMSRVTGSNDLDSYRPNYGAWVDANNDGIPDEDEVTSFEQAVGSTHQYVARGLEAITTDVNLGIDRQQNFIAEEMFLLT